MKRSTFAASAVIAALSAGSTPVYAQDFFGDLGRSVSDAAQSVGEAVGDAVNQAGRAITDANDVVQVITAPAQIPFEVTESLTPGLKFNPFDPLAGPTFVTPDEAFRNWERLPETIDNNLNPAGSMLARAIRNGERQSQGACRPVPDFVRRALGPGWNDAFAGTCFSTSWEATTDFSIQKYLLRYKANAVTLGHVIVFRSIDEALSDTPETIALWAHELTHIRQYKQLRVDGFAARYANGAFDDIFHGQDAMPDLEDVAYAVEDQVLDEVRDARRASERPSWGTSGRPSWGGSDRPSWGGSDRPIWRSSELRAPVPPMPPPMPRPTMCVSVTPQRFFVPFMGPIGAPCPVPSPFGMLPGIIQ